MLPSPSEKRRDMAPPLVVIHSAVLLLLGSDVFLVGANRPPAPVNVSVIHLRSDSATVSWEVPEGEIIIGFSVSQQGPDPWRWIFNVFFPPPQTLKRQDGHMQRFIREVNTTSRSCVLWDLEEETDYIIQVQAIGLYGESQASKKVHFRTLKKTDRFPSNSSNQDDPTVQGLERSRHLQTGEVIIIVVVLLMWAVSPIRAVHQHHRSVTAKKKKRHTRDANDFYGLSCPLIGLLRVYLMKRPRP
ncbi:fibronectin type III domain-containing protein 4 isoform X2 [Vanacampus margaritifer]